MRLKVVCFGLPNKPSETPAPVWAMVRNRRISHAEHRNLLKEGFGAQTENKPTGKAQRNDRAVRGSEGERSEPEGRAFWRKAQRNDRTVRSSEGERSEPEA